MRPKGASKQRRKGARDEGGPLKDEEGYLRSRNLQRGQNRAVVGTLNEYGAGFALAHRLGEIEIDRRRRSVPACELPQVAHDIVLA